MVGMGQVVLKINQDNVVSYDKQKHCIEKTVYDLQDFQLFSPYRLMDQIAFWQQELLSPVDN